MIKNSYSYTKKQYEKMGLKVKYKLFEKQGYNIMDRQGKTLFILDSWHDLEDKLKELNHKIKTIRKGANKMIKYLLELNEDMEDNGLTLEELYEIKGKSREELEEEYNTFYDNGIDNSYMQLIESVIVQLQRNQPIITGLDILKSEIDTELEQAEEDKDYDKIEELEDLSIAVLKDILLIEDLFYEEFIYYLPIKYYNDNIALRTYFNDFLDSLEKNDRIMTFTVENLDYSITPTDIEKIQ